MCRVSWQVVDLEVLIVQFQAESEDVRTERVNSIVLIQRLAG